MISLSLVRPFILFNMVDIRQIGRLILEEQHEKENRELSDIDILHLLISHVHVLLMRIPCRLQRERRNSSYSHESSRTARTISLWNGVVPDLLLITNRNMDHSHARSSSLRSIAFHCRFVVLYQQSHAIEGSRLNTRLRLLPSRTACGAFRESNPVCVWVSTDD